MRFSKRLLATSSLLSLIIPHHSVAQVRASELGTVSQTIDGTKVSVTYSRPRARGRDQIYGTRIVHWNEIWTPGANVSTTFETSKDIEINGHPVKAGKYAVWFVVRERGDWTFMLDTMAGRYHTFRPDTAKAAVRFPVQVQNVPFTEVLTWSFPDYRIDGGVLQFAWGQKSLKVDYKVQPSLHVPLTSEESKPYVGRYSVAFTRQPDKPPRELTVEFARDTLKAYWDKKDVGDGMQGPLVQYMGTFAMIKVAPDWFVPGLFDETGRIYEVMRPEMTFQFTNANGRAESFEIRNGRDMVFAKGTRK